MSTRKAIQVKYSCAACGIYRRVLTVPERTAGEDIKAWMDRTAARVSDDHAQTSPLCVSRVMSELMIPLYEDAKGVGQAGAVPVKADEGGEGCN